jgi:Putative DNA-binding domain
MEQGQIQVDQLATVLGDTKVYLRAALVESDGRWIIGRFEAVVGACPAHWTPQIWLYEGVAFASSEVSARDFAAGLAATAEHTLPIVTLTAEMPLLQSHANWRREPGRRPHAGLLLPWPTCDIEVYRRDGQWQSQPRGLLVSEAAPPFPSFESACRAFFYGDFSLAVGSQASADMGRIRVAQTGAWLQRVQVTPTHLDVEVAGDAVQGTRVALNGATHRVAAMVTRPGVVRLPLPLGLPEDGWLFLSRGTSWLDYRALGHRVTGPQDLARAGVEVVVPDDPTNQLETLLSMGEGPRAEYKRMIPTGADNPDAKRKVFKTVAAFANGDGGDVLFGVEPDEVTICGVQGDLQQERDRLGNLVRSIVVPTPDFAVQSYEVDGKAVLALAVQPGTAGPYGIRFGNGVVEFYVRRGASTYPATQDEIRSLAQAHTAVQKPVSDWGLW